MKSIEKLEENYKRELELAEKHKQNASDIKKEIELLKGNMINQKTKALNLSGAEYDRFMKLLGSDKKTVLEAIGLVLGEDAVQELSEPADTEKGEDENDFNRSLEGEEDESRN